MSKWRLISNTEVSNGEKSFSSDRTADILWLCDKLNANEYTEKLAKFGAMVLEHMINRAEKWDATKQTHDVAECLGLISRNAMQYCVYKDTDIKEAVEELTRE